jgi:hypothetical protein
MQTKWWETPPVRFIGWGNLATVEIKKNFAELTSVFTLKGRWGNASCKES